MFSSLTQHGSVVASTAECLRSTLDDRVGESHRDHDDDDDDDDDGSLEGEEEEEGVLIKDNPACGGALQLVATIFFFYK